MKHDPIPDFTDTEMALVRETTTERFRTEDETRATKETARPA